MELKFNERRLDLKVNENWVLERILELDDDFYLKKSEFCNFFKELGSCSVKTAWKGLEKKGYIVTHKNSCDALSRYTYDVVIDKVIVKKFNYKYVPQNQTRFDMGSNYVYLYSHQGNDNVKIGVTNNLQNRLNSLNIGSGYQSNFLFCGKTHRHIEGVLHRIFLYKRVWGEWFALDKKDIEKAIEIIKENEIH